MIRTYLEHLPTEALISRLAQIEALAAATKARIEKGACSGPFTPYIHKGEWMSASREETALNGQRGAWKTTRQEIMNRFIPA